MTTIYHNPRCSKSRATLALLQERGIEPEVVLYLDAPPSVAVLKELTAMLGCSVREIIRRGEDVYRELGLRDAGLSEEALLAAVAAHPRLLERPIVVHGDKAVVGRPSENVLGIL